MGRKPSGLGLAQRKALSLKTRKRSGLEAGESSGNQSGQKHGDSPGSVQTEALRGCEGDILQREREHGEGEPGEKHLCYCHKILGDPQTTILQII